MANRNISTELWNDPQIVDEFTKDDIYVWLYLLTSPHTYLCGVLKVGLTNMSFETKMDKDELEKTINRLADNHHLIKYNKENNEILILNWHKHNWSTSEKLKTSVRKSLKNIKTKEFIEYITLELNNKV